MTLAPLVDIIEAAYEIDRSDEDWLAGLARAARPIVDRGMGAAAYMYDARDPAKFRVLSSHLPSEIDPAAMKGFLESVPAEYVTSTWPMPFGLASSTEGFEGPLENGLHAMFGARDVLAINGWDRSGYGVWLGSLAPMRIEMDHEQAALLERIATHLASAHRLRRKVRRMAVAVLEPSGAIVEASGDAALSQAREVLSTAAKQIEEARGPMRRNDTGRAVGRWKGLVAARWTLVDKFESDGKRYIVAQQNAHEAETSNDLSPREQAVLAAMAAGHHDKLIAYELGLASSTVRVLLFRAMRKLGASTRAEAVAAFRAASTKR